MAIYWQIVLTYVTRKLFWLLLGIILLFGLPRLSTQPDLAQQVAILTLAPMFITCLGMLVGIHLKHQFANPRSTCLPNFRGPHLVVAAAICLSQIGLLAGLGSLVPEFSFSGILAALLVLLMLALWIGCSPNRAVGAVFIFPLCVPMSAFGRGLLMEIISGREPLLAGCLISGSVAGLILFADHLLSLSEDDPAYGLVYPMNPWDLRATAQRSIQRCLGQREGWLLDLMMLGTSARLTRATAEPATTFWRRVELFRIGETTPAHFAYSFAVIVLCELGFLCWMGRFILSEQNLRVALAFPLTFAVVVACGQWLPWLSRWSRMGYESLRPVTRRQWVVENGAGILWSTATLDACLIAVQVVAIACFLPQFASSPVLLEALLIALSGQVLAFGVSAWVASFGSVFLLTAWVGAALQFAFVPWFFTGLGKMPQVSFGGLMFLGLANLVVGAGFLRMGFRRWCRMDLP